MALLNDNVRLRMQRRVALTATDILFILALIKTEVVP